MRHHSAVADGQELSVGEDDAEEGFGQQRGAVEAFGAEEAEAEGARALGEGDVDVVEDLDVVTEEADGLEDECGVAFGADGGEGVFDGGADPGAPGDALALEGEEPFLKMGELARGGGEDEGGGAPGLDGVGVGGGVGFAGLDGAAWDGVGGEEDGEGFGSRVGAGAGVSVDEALGEGFYEGGFIGPGFDEGEGWPGGGGTLRGFGFDGCGEGAAVEAGAGAGVLRGETDGEDAGDAVGAHLADDGGDEGMPVTHGHVDAQGMAGGSEGRFEQMGLGEGPAGEGWGLGCGGLAEADLGVAVLEFGDDRGRERAAAGDFGQVLGHLAEDVGSAVGEEEDSGRGWLGHAWIILY